MDMILSAAYSSSNYIYHILLAHFGPHPCIRLLYLDNAWTFKRQEALSGSRTRIEGSRTRTSAENEGRSNDVSFNKGGMGSIVVVPKER
jgi:hypothetical protein